MNFGKYCKILSSVVHWKVGTFEIFLVADFGQNSKSATKKSCRFLLLAEEGKIEKEKGKSVRSPPIVLMVVVSMGMSLAITLGSQTLAVQQPSDITQLSIQSPSDFIPVGDEMVTVIQSPPIHQVPNRSENPGVLNNVNNGMWKGGVCLGTELAGCTEHLLFIAEYSRTLEIGSGEAEKGGVCLGTELAG